MISCILPILWEKSDVRVLIKYCFCVNMIAKDSNSESYLFEPGKLFDHIPVWLILKHTKLSYCLGVLIVDGWGQRFSKGPHFLPLTRGELAGRVTKICLWSMFGGPNKNLTHSGRKHSFLHYISQTWAYKLISGSPCRKS